MANNIDTIIGEPMPQTEEKAIYRRLYEEEYSRKDSHILSGAEQLYLTTDDVALVPAYGKLNSRSQAHMDGFIYSSPMDTVTGIKLTDQMVRHNHYAVVCRFLTDEWQESFTKYHSNQNVFFALGSKEKDKLILEDAVKSLGQYNTPLVSINIDVAHGDTVQVQELYSWYSSKPYVDQIMSGSISTPSAAIRCIKNGCTHLRIGIGPGAACTTRLKTGCGIPQLSCVYKIHAALVKEGLRNKVKLIADGGIRNPGDAVKYMSAGADGIMMGKMFTKCPESSGWIQKTSWQFWKKPILWKRYRGQASQSFQKDILGKIPDCAEGATGPVIHPGKSAKHVINEFEGGVRSAISYLGLTSLRDLEPSKVKFIRVTPSAIAEGKPHGTQ